MCSRPKRTRQDAAAETVTDVLSLADAKRAKLEHADAGPAAEEEDVLNALGEDVCLRMLRLLVNKSNIPATQVRECGTIARA